MEAPSRRHPVPSRRRCFWGKGHSVLWRATFDVRCGRRAYGRRFYPCGFWAMLGWSPGCGPNGLRHVVLVGIQAENFCAGRIYGRARRVAAGHFSGPGRHSEQRYGLCAPQGGLALAARRGGGAQTLPRRGLCPGGGQQPVRPGARHVRPGGPARAGSLDQRRSGGQGRGH